MPISKPGLDTRSEPTLGCFTDAILLREGPGAVASTYVRGSSLPPAPPIAPLPPVPPLPPLPLSSGTLTPTPTSSSEPAPFLTRGSAFPAAHPVVIVRADPRPAPMASQARSSTVGARAAGRCGRSRAGRSGAGALAKRWGRRLPWTAFAGFALGASLACLTGIFTAAGSVGLAAGASLLAGSVTLYVALTRES